MMPIVLVGCAARIPIYPALSNTDSLNAISQRLDSVTTISATADLTLIDAQGQTVTLDGAFVAHPPHQARLRAWKFGSPVLDLTILPEGVWAFAASREGTSPSDLSKLPAAGVSQSIQMLSGAYFAHAHVIEADSTPAILVVVGPVFGRDDVRCEIDRATLTPRQFVINADGKVMRLILDRYTLIGATVWAQRMEFKTPEGTIVIRLSDIELNGELTESAFVPPGRARQLP